MTYVGAKDLMLEIARGNVPGHSPVNKFGEAPFGVQTTITDIWDRANASATQQIWVAPTQARIHQITSASTDDDGVPVGTGARTIRVYGLTAWNADEVSEEKIMNGTGNVATTNAYVIIHRMKVLTKGASGPNVGVITATADTDGTITAQINAGEGQTQMAIYGVPSTKKAYMTNYYFSMPDTGAGPSTVNAAKTKLVINPEPDAELTTFLTKHTNGMSNTATSKAGHKYEP